MNPFTVNDAFTLLIYVLSLKFAKKSCELTCLQLDRTTGMTGGKVSPPVQTDRVVLVVMTTAPSVASRR